MVKNLPVGQEAQVQSLGQEDPLEKGMAAHTSILAWRIPWTEGPGRLYSPWGHKEADTTERLTHTHTHTQNKEHSTNQGDIPSRFLFLFEKKAHIQSQFDLGTQEGSFIIEEISALVSQEGRH